jgi:hypothetical protein
LVHDLGARTSLYRRHFDGGQESNGWTVDDHVLVRSLDETELEAVLEEAGLGMARTWTAGTTIRVIAAPLPRGHRSYPPTAGRYPHRG